VGEALEEGQLDAAALFRRQPVEGGMDAALALDRFQACGADRMDRGEQRIARDLFLPAPRGVPPPDAVERPRARQHEDPAARRGAVRIVAAGLRPHLEEDLLEDLLGLAPPSQDAEQQTEDQRRMQVEDLGQSFALTCSNPSHEVDLVAWPGIHGGGHPTAASGRGESSKKMHNPAITRI